jgi:methionyl-tRNA synthetase
MRTTEKAHHDTVESVWRYLDAKSLIYKTSYSGWYSVSDECFYPPSQITRLPSSPGIPEIVVSAETGSRVEWNQEENYMFRLSAFRELLRKHYLTNPETIFPPQHHEYIMDVLDGKWGELEDLSISRPKERLTWGVRVPGDEDHTIYVWFDALSVYLSGIGYPWSGDSAVPAWPADMQIIGKDILRFHAIYFPAMLLALDLPLPKKLLSHAHWTVNQKKMSKSVGNVADPFEAMDKFGVDVVRYYLTRVGGRFRDDVDWSDEQLDKHRAEIVAYIGNFFMRITSNKIVTNVEKARARSLQDVFDELPNDDPNKITIAMKNALPDKVASCLARLEVANALQEIVDVLKQANGAMTKTAPWSSSPAIAQASCLTSLETLRVCGICLQPFVPSVAERLLNALGVPPGERAWNNATHGRGSVDHELVKRGTRLFQV